MEEALGRDCLPTGSEAECGEVDEVHELIVSTGGSNDADVPLPPSSMTPAPACSFLTPRFLNGGLSIETILFATICTRDNCTRTIGTRR